MYQALLIITDRQYARVDQISRYLKKFVEVIQWGRYGTYDSKLADQS